MSANLDAWRNVRELILPAVLLGAALGLIHALDLDHVISDRFYDPVTRSFPWRHTALADRLMHRGVRDATVLYGLAGVVACVGGRWWMSARSYRAVVVVTLSLALCTATVAALKAVVNRSCPWNLARYGGTAVENDPGQPLIRLSGHDLAFPAGHAAGGFSLFILYFVGRRRSVVAGRLGLAAALVVGGATGFAQVVRGAHFLSHNVWTAAVCWYITWGVDRAVRLPPETATASETR